MSRAISISMKLLAYSKKYNVNHQMILIRFFHERLLYRVSISDYREHLHLKGGNLLYSFQENTARPTVDIDFSGSNITNDVEEIKQIFLQIINTPVDDAVIFDTETMTVSEINEQHQYIGVRVKILAQLANIKQHIQIDIGFGDVITPAPITIHYPVLLDGFETPIIKAYTVETAIAEKLQAIMVLAQLNSRMKDFYDIITLSEQEQINYETLRDAVRNTFENRNTSLDFDSVVFTASFYNDNTRIRMWKVFLKKINADEIPFEYVVKKIQELVVQLK